ncbi:hypothetical protein Xmir_03063 [Xenorhabdus miraniensis]|uniref:Uncharacterized protein n=1 Tax=Xenorhabdus miraniensis TaxID=351674 RepID=A0A2D0JMM2_9GAMM|nr:hypothetical protein Xmir_03063 [Xenorhabdus miraniensis]
MKNKNLISDLLIEILSLSIFSVSFAGGKGGKGGDN